jgi:hypothetical protein
LRRQQRLQYKTLSFLQTAKTLCAQLVRLELNANKLSGPLPATVSDCRSLNVLDVSDNPGITGA